VAILFKPNVTTTPKAKSTQNLLKAKYLPWYQQFGNQSQIHLKKVE
jgi:hypothetical protein